MSDLSNNLYKGMSSYGQQPATMSLIIGIIIAIILCCVAFLIFFMDNSNLVDSLGTIVAANCTQYMDINRVIIYNCALDIEYNVYGQIYKARINDQTNIPYQLGSQYAISYDKNNPSSVQKQVTRNRWISSLLSSSAIIIIIIVGIVYFIMQSNFAK